MFSFFLGVALLCLGVIPLIACFLMFLFDGRRTAIQNLPGALIVFCVMGFIGYNTLAMELGWDTLG
jgi:hypothetical protein